MKSFDEILFDCRHYNFKPNKHEVGGRELDQEAIRSYLNLWGSSEKCKLAKKLVTTILSNTRYIDFDEFYAELTKNFAKFAAEQKRPFKIILSCDKFGSESWLMHLLYPLFARMKPLFLGTISKFEGNSQIDYVLLDDCVYTGSKLIQNLKYFLGSSKSSVNAKIIMAFINTSRIETVRIELDGFLVGTQLYGTPLDLDNFDHLLCNSVNTNSRNCEELLNNILCNLGAIPVYFDHKIAEEFSSFPGIYLDGAYLDNNEQVQMFGQLVKRVPSRSKIDYVKNIHQILYRKSKPC